MRTILFAALLAMAVGANAQERNDSTRRRHFDPKEMVQRRTDDAVGKYGLDEAQAKKLLELNQKYDTLMMRPMGGPGRGPRPDRQQPTDEQKAKMEEGRKKMEEARKAYDAELQGILTTEQYEKYKADSQRRRGPRRPR